MAEHNAYVVAFGEEDRKLGNARIDDLTNDVRCQFVVGLNNDFARIGVHNISNGIRAFQVFRIDLEAFDLRLLDVVVNRGCDLLPGMYKDFLGLGMRDVLRNFQPDNVVRHVPENLFPFDRQAVGLVKGADDLFITLEAKSTQKDGREKLPFPVDSDI